jgi:hypothetical protein
MFSADRQLRPQVALLILVVSVAGCSSGKPNAGPQTAAPSTTVVVSGDRAEQLASHNLPPAFQVPMEGSIDFDVVLPSTYDWKEQERIVSCIRQTYAELDDSAVFSSVVDHVFDPRYCVSIWRLKTRENLSVGDVCREILQSRAEGFIRLPSNRKGPKEAFSFQARQSDLLEWWRLHKKTSLIDVQLEAISDSTAAFEETAQRATDANEPIPEYVQDHLKHLEKLRRDIRERSQPIPVKPKEQGVVKLSSGTVFQFESEYFLEADFKKEISKGIDSTVATDETFGAGVYLRRSEVPKSIKGPVLDFTDAETARLWRFDSKNAMNESSRPLRLMIAEQAKKRGYDCIKFVSNGDDVATVAVIVSPAGRRALLEEE